MTPNELIEIATEFYLNSRDFNGYPAHLIHQKYCKSYETIRKLFSDLVTDGRGTIVFNPNPHIRAFTDAPMKEQLKKLESAPLEHTCLYPSPQHLSSVVAHTDYQDRPFTHELALGAGQLEFRSFDLSVLENYRNDPRYRYKNDAIRGRIVVADEFYGSNEIHEKDQIILKTFGFSYDKQMNRAVAAFLIYLSRLSPEHQQTWNSKRLTGDFELHPDYFRNTISGEWGSHISIFNAFIEELKIIDLMCKAMDRPRLFRDNFENNRPRNFSFLVRPTQEEFNSFVLTLDKMMSDNINKNFFKDEVSGETEEERDDGKIIVRRKGTIAILQEWIEISFQLNDPKSIEDIIAAFKQVRKLRQKPAHAVQANVFDQKFFHQQRELVVSAYKAIRTIRLILANYPAVENADIKIPELLYKGKIWTR